MEASLEHAARHAHFFAHLRNVDFPAGEFADKPHCVRNVGVFDRQHVGRSPRGHASGGTRIGFRGGFSPPIIRSSKAAAS